MKQSKECFITYPNNSECFEKCRKNTILDVGIVDEITLLLA